MPAKKKKRIRKKRSPLRAIVAFVAVTMLAWAIWTLLDNYLFPDKPMLNSFIAGAVGFLILVVDDFRLKELE